MTGKRIRHMVIFNLKYGKASAEADKFLTDGKAVLTQIPVVEGFEVLMQVSPKNDYDFGFSMEFADQAAYEAYNSHPQHVNFVKEHWVKEVTSFLEIDFKGI